jgi:hypothetical protein
MTCHWKVRQKGTGPESHKNAVDIPAGISEKGQHKNLIHVKKLTNHGKKSLAADPVYKRMPPSQGEKQNAPSFAASTTRATPAGRGADTAPAEYSPGSSRA